MPQKRKLLGPFTELLTMNGIPEKGHIKDEQLTIVADAGIAVEDGMITEIGKFDEMQGEKEKETRAPCVAIPGLIDSHTHICFAGSRARDYASRLNGLSYQEIAKRGGGILDTVRKTRQAPQEELACSMSQRTAQLMRWGVTTCEVKSGYGLSVESEIKMLEAIKQVNLDQPVQLISTCLAAHTKPWEFNEGIEYLSYLENELLPLIKEKQLASRIDIFVEEHAFSVEQARPYLHAAKALGFSLSMHVDQFSRGGALLAAELGADTADHLEVSKSQDFEALAKAGVYPVVVPGASLGLGMPFAPAKEILDHNLPLVIASDWNPGSAPMGDLLTEAAFLGAAENLSMAETLAAITLRAANALKLHDRGVIAVGKRADLAIYPCSDYREILYHQGAMKPTAVVIGGHLYA